MRYAGGMYQTDVFVANLQPNLIAKKLKIGQDLSKL